MGVNNMKELSDLIFNAFGIGFSISELADRTGLPRYLSSGREIYVGRSEEASMLIVRLQEPVDSRVLSREQTVYENTFRMPVAFLFDTLNKSYRNAYVKHHIPFILVPTQVYLPFLGILFSRKFSGESLKSRKKLTPNAQLVLLFMIYNEKKEYAKQFLSEQLNLDPVYVTRATKELADHGLLEERKVGRNSFVYRTTAAKDLFELSKPFLADPVHEVIHVRKEKAVESMPFAADEALSHLGMLNPPEISVRACYRKNDVIKALKEVEDPAWEEPWTVCSIQLWNYDPELLKADAAVDIISLYCSLRDSHDARVSGESERLLEEYEWLS